MAGEPVVVVDRARVAVAAVGAEAGDAVEVGLVGKQPGAGGDAAPLERLC
ncbi:MAG TPA: hypothetical protein VGQ84_05085 [Gaiellaceae bacterium]|nr:hypothetical protein [Gaiellaceae bacterium]